MQILVINCGSSSIKGSIIDHYSGEKLVAVKVERLGKEGTIYSIDDHDAVPLDATDHAGALATVLPKMQEAIGSEDIEAVGHRVVHGGERFVHPTLIDDEVEGVIEELFELAPLHNPANLAGIRAARALLPNIPHVACFDTAFHSTLPRRAREYALDIEDAKMIGARRYGFHGISHKFVSDRTADHMESHLRDLRVITCHLGNGCSAAAVEYGRSVETSMGMTPLEGLVMGSRSGDIDAGIVLQMLRKGKSIDEVDDTLNRKSGLAGLSGVGNDLRDIEQQASEGNDRCRLAIQVFAHRVRKYIGAYAAVMGGVDAIVFTGGIGENSEVMRHRIAQRLDFLGAVLDEDANRDVALTEGDPVAEISTRNSRCRLLVVKTDEQRAIGRDTAKIALDMDQTKGEGLTIPVAVSARHVHLTQETVEQLFGAGYQLTERNPLSQPGQFACNEQVTVVGPKRQLEKVRILGPTRSKNQIEISRTDEFFLGVDAPVRASGDVENSPGCTLIGPHGSAVLKQGLICAWRHIHMTPEDAERFGVQDRDIVEVAISSEGRDLVFGDVLVRVKSSYKLEMHIDTDEGNAADLSRGARGVLTDTEGLAHLRKRQTKYDRVES